MIIKQILKKNILVMIIIFISGIFVIMLSHNLYKTNVYETISNDLYKNDSIHFTQFNSIELEDLIYISGDTFVSKELSDIMRGIYFSSQYDYQLPTLEGRFFNYNDFKIENNYVVIGKALHDYVYTRDKKSYYTLNNIEYQVIGVLGIDTEVESILDNLIC